MINIETASGRKIKTMSDWASIYENPQQNHQWKEYRSAHSVAEFIINKNGAEAIRQRVSDALGYDVHFDKIIPELEIRFDKFGRGRVHDLGIYGSTDSGKRLFVGVEAKVDESFGSYALDSYLQAKSKQIVGISTKAPERIEQLLALHFSKPDPSMFNVRYQLLYATAGTLAAEADIHVLFVAVFKTPLYDLDIGSKNYNDYMQFMSKVGAEQINLQTEGAIGHRLSLQDKELVCLHEYFQL